MRLLRNKTLPVILFLSLFTIIPVQSQTADDTDGRLYLFCKTWGYVKYFNQNNCFRVWDQYLPGAINEIIAAPNNAEFNNIILRFLNQAGNNAVVADPPALPDTNLLVNTEWTQDLRFSPEVRNFFATFTANVHPQRLACMVRVNTGTIPRAYGFIDFTQDTIDMAVNYSQVSHRLTTVFYYWNVINYFYPYRNLMDESWDSVLLRFIPLFRKPMTNIDFEKMFLKLVANIDDTHGMTASPQLTQSFWHGTHRPRIALERIEDQCVVTKVDSIEGVLPGDILEAVNGRTIQQLVDSLGPFIAASNQAVFYREIYSNMLRGSRGTEMELTLSNRSGESYSVIVARDIDINEWLTWKRKGPFEGSYAMTPCGYGYVNMGQLLTEEIPAMYDSLRSAPAIIFDVRNYPNGTISTLVPYFFSAPFTSARFHVPALYMYLSGRIREFLPGWYNFDDNLLQFGSFNNPTPYAGMVYILVNQETQSHGEYTSQILSYHPNARVIGTQTAGADGNVTGLYLPNGMVTLFTSIGLYYADGYQQQRNGVRIDSLVAPTIRGIREGRDEILEAAIHCTSGISNRIEPSFSINLYPNPVTGGVLEAAIGVDQPGMIRFSLKDISGRVIRDWSSWADTGVKVERIDLSGQDHGIYFLQVTNPEGYAKAVKLIK